MTSIGIFIACSERFREINWLTESSIRANTSADLDIYVIEPADVGMEESGCTGFSMVRWAVPELCREYGHDFGIYLDCDMIVLGDITELFEYARKGKWVTLEDGSDEVSIICASLRYPPKESIQRRHKGTLHMGWRDALIPACWNVEDRVEDGMKLLHFTSLDNQPWFYDHPDDEAVAIWEEYQGRFL